MVNLISWSTRDREYMYIYHVGEVPVINECLVVRLSLWHQISDVVVDHTLSLAVPSSTAAPVIVTIINSSCESSIITHCSVSLVACIASLS